jgi:subtilisin family serine protease
LQPSIIIGAKNRRKENMKKALLISIILLSMLALTIAPMTRSTTPAPNLKYSVTPIHEQFVEEATGEPLPLPTGNYLGYDIDMVNAEYFANGGEGIYIAVIDTGLVWNWPIFLPPTANVRTDLGRGWSYDVVWDSGLSDFVWTPNATRGFITNDVGSGHGTHVTSTIVGYQRSTIGVVPHIVLGVAPNATIIPILGLDYWLVDCPPDYPGSKGGKVMFGGGDDWMLCSAIDYVANLAEAYGWKIICTNSWGSSEPSPAIRVSIDNAISKGVIFVFAAGNAGDAGMDWPGAYPEVISCAAGGWTMQMLGAGTSSPPSPYRWYLSDVPEKLNTNDALGNNWQIFLAEFSGRPNAALGQSWKDLDVCAPGSYVVGPFKPEAYWDDDLHDWVITKATAYYGLWGTSMSAPHVAGVAAIVAQYYPSFNQADMEYVLKKAATRIPLSSNTKYAYDPFYGPAFYNNDHDAGAGWLTADNALKTGSVYHK